MADMITFPNTFEEFIHQYEFKDKDEIYTNGAELIPSFRVMQAWEHYTESFKKIQTEITNIVNIINMAEDSIFDLSTHIDMIQNNIYNIEDEINEL